MSMLSKINRYREIFSVLTKYGLAGWIARLNLDFARDIFDRKIENLTHYSTAQRIRMAITDLGPTFIKLGQILSTRPDLINAELAEELKHLQSNVPADTPEMVSETIEGEFSQTTEELFAEFDLKALASASIGQVHLATLKTGEEVVVKVQHQGIEENIRLDLEILIDIADLLESYVEESRNYRPRDTSEEFKRLLLKELDFLREKRNLERFALNFSGDKNIQIPKVFPEYCTSKVLTMEKMKGIPISNKEELIRRGYDVGILARLGADMFLRMIFIHGFYHADPHPGNIFALGDNQLGLIDCGMVGRLDDELREDIEDLLMSLVQNNGRKLTNIIIRIGAIPRDFDRHALQADIKEFADYYSSMTIQEMNLQKAMEEMTDVIRRHKIILPSSISLLIKVLVMLEGTSHSLSPDFDIISIIKPYKSKIIARRISPARQKRVIENFMMDWERVIKTVPMGLVNIVDKIQEGNLHVKFEHQRLEDSVNRLVFGLVISALFLGSSLLLAFQTPPLIGKTSFPGIVGHVFSFIGGIYLLWELYRAKKFRR